MLIREFGQLIFDEIRTFGYEWDEEPDMVVDFVEELYDVIIGVWPQAVLTLTKEFTTTIVFYFKTSPNCLDYKLNNMTQAVGISKGVLRKTISEPENLGAIIGKIRWIPQGC